MFLKCKLDFRIEFWMEISLLSETASVVCPVGNIILPGNSVSLTYFGRTCSLCVEAITGEDGATLRRLPPGMTFDPTEASGLDSVLDSTPADLSLQLSLLTVDDTSAGESPGAPAASTPCRPSNPPCLSSPSDSSHNPPADESAEGAVSLENSIISEQAVKSPTAPPGGAQSTDTFYCLSCSTKVCYKEQPQQREEPDGESRGSKVMYSMIGGLNSQLDVIRETIELPLKHPELFSNYGAST